MSNIISKFKNGLKKTRNNFANKIDDLFSRHLKIDDDLYEELEEILISADIGVEATLEIIEMLQDEIKEEKIQDINKVKPLLKKILVEEIKFDEDFNNDGKSII